MATILLMTFSNAFSWMKMCWFRLKFQWSFIPKSSINNIPELVQIMPRRLPVDKPLFEPMMIISQMHICVIQHQRGNLARDNSGICVAHVVFCFVFNDKILTTINYNFKIQIRPKTAWNQVLRPKMIFLSPAQHYLLCHIWLCRGVCIISWPISVLTIMRIFVLWLWEYLYLIALNHEYKSLGTVYD